LTRRRHVLILFAWWKKTVNCTRSGCWSSCAISAKACGARRQSSISAWDKLLQQLANPNLHDIPSNLQIHVELWDRYDKHIRWVIAATSSIVIGNAAFDVAVSVHPQERVLLRQGIRVIREHVPKIDLVREPSMAPGSGGA
jgi:hypothetical protein